MVAGTPGLLAPRVSDDVACRFLLLTVIVVYEYQQDVTWSRQGSRRREPLVASNDKGIGPMKKEIVHIPGIINNPGTFHHVVKVGGLLFLSSQVSADLTTGKILPGTIAEQMARAMENIKFLLESCGSRMDDVVKVVIYMRNVNDRSAINDIFRQYFTAGQEPAKISVQAPSPIAGIDVEIEATAVARG